MIADKAAWDIHIPDTEQFLDEPFSPTRKYNQLAELVSIHLLREYGALLYGDLHSLTDIFLITMSEEICLYPIVKITTAPTCAAYNVGYNLFKVYFSLQGHFEADRLSHFWT